MTAVKIGVEVLPAVVGWISDLINAGRSPDEATDIVRRDIESRREQYHEARDADLAALDAKWDDVTPAGGE